MGEQCSFPQHSIHCPGGLLWTFSLDNQIEIQLKLKDQKANDKLNLLTKESQGYIQEINNYKIKLNKLNQNLQKTNNRIEEIEEEKKNMEEILVKQEEKLTKYIDRLNELEITFKSIEL